MIFSRKTPPQPTPYGIAQLKEIPLGGVKQWVLIRGENVRKPVLLILHGGPGMSLISISSAFFRQLEKDFVVVNWDQRGSGLSYDPDLDEKTMNIRQFVSDICELSEYLRRRFHKEKIFLLGHSWGSLIGTLAVKQAPELFYAYVGAGQVVDMARNEEIAYQELLDFAQKENRPGLLSKLEETGPPPHQKPVDTMILRFGLTMTHRDAWNGDVSMRKKIFRAAFASKEYRAADLARYLKATSFSMKNLWWQAVEVDLKREAPDLSIPCIYILGRNDQIVLPQLSVEYYDLLKAPYKKLIWFEGCGHSMMYEQPEKFQQVVAEELMPFVPKLPKPKG